MSFNSAQILAITHTEGPCMVLAGPGSGKTTVITRRIESLIQDHKVSPEEILVITFSKAAAKEMRERFFALSAAENQGVTFGTFHGGYYGILRWDYQLRPTCIMSEKEKLSILRQVCEKRNTDYREDLDFLKSLAEEIGIVKNNLISLDAYGSTCCEADRFCQIYRLYEEMRTKRRKMDFDDMLLMTYQLFQERPDLLHIWQKKFRYIMVDEFQDINQVQYEVLKMLAAPRNNLFIVGDDDQSIYKFRGANISNILDFEKVFSDAKVIKLEQNYRSTQNILDAANEVIKNNIERKDKALWTNQGPGERLHYRQFDTAYEEAEYIAFEILKKRRNAEADFGDCAILYRTNAQSRILEERFVREGIPYELVGGTNFYSRKEIKDMLAYLKTIDNGKDDLAVKRIINVPKRGIGAATLSKVQDYADEMGISFFDAMCRAEQITTLGKSGAKLMPFVNMIQVFRSKVSIYGLKKLMEDI